MPPSILDQTINIQTLENDAKEQNFVDEIEKEYISKKLGNYKECLSSGDEEVYSKIMVFLDNSDIVDRKKTSGRETIYYIKIRDGVQCGEVHLTQNHSRYMVDGISLTPIIKSKLYGIIRENKNGRAKN